MQYAYGIREHEVIGAMATDVYIDGLVEPEPRGEGFDDQEPDESVKKLDAGYLETWYRNFGNLAARYRKGSDDDLNYRYWHAYYTGRAETYKSLLREFFPEDWRRIDEEERKRKGGLHG